MLSSYSPINSRQAALQSQLLLDLSGCNEALTPRQLDDRSLLGYIIGARRGAGGPVTDGAFFMLSDPPALDSPVVAAHQPSSSSIAVGSPQLPVGWHSDDLRR